jgi:hypothetical protein
MTERVNGIPDILASIGASEVPTSTSSAPRSALPTRSLARTLPGLVAPIWPQRPLANHHQLAPYPDPATTINPHYPVGVFIDFNIHLYPASLLANTIGTALMVCPAACEPFSAIQPCVMLAWLWVFPIRRR